MKLFPFQEKEVKAILAGFESGQTIQCLAWYTGAGKTNVFTEVCRVLIEQDPDVNIGVSAYLTKEIRDQVYDRFLEFGMAEQVHLVTSRRAKHNPDKNVTVFNPQCMLTNTPDAKFDYFIIDESHVGTDDSCTMLPRIIARTCHKDTKFLLVSATPWDTLALKKFKDAIVYKRSLDKGLGDGLITDARFHAEEAQITFKADDFSRLGDLTNNAMTREMAVIKSACMGKMDHILLTYGATMGNKVLVVCPPGNAGEIAQDMATRYHGLAFLMGQGGHAKAAYRWIRTEENLRKFMSDPKVRFLFVVNKCQVGFDYKDLTAVIDLTMSRNIKLLAQRFGRIARKGNQNKHYFYVYDKSLMKDRLEWVICTMIDFCLGHYDGWTSKTAKFRSVQVNRNFGAVYPISVTLREVIKALREENVKNMKTLKFVNYSPKVLWTLPIAKKEAAKYESRTDMWARRPALYKWFRLNAKAEMDRIFPAIYRRGWDETKVIAAMKGCKSRQEFNAKFPGARWWIESRKRQELKEKYLPESKSTRKWTTKTARTKLKTIRSWSHVRNNYNGLRRWMSENGGELYWQDQWKKIRTKEKLAPFLGKK